MNRLQVCRNFGALPARFLWRVGQSPGLALRELLPRARIAEWRSLIPISILLLLSAPLLFYNAFVWPMPKGFAGLYALFGELIASNPYRLPVEVPYYGPGGIPFVYPPLAIYLMAFLTTELHIAPLTYLRFFPALVAWLSLIPVYALARALVGSAPRAAIAAFLFGSAPAIFIMHVYAGGAVRAPAFLFAMLGLWLACRTMDRGRFQAAILAGLCLAATALTHLGYLFFFALSLGTFALIGPWPGKRLKWAILILALGFGFSSPWWLSIGLRYGIDVFRNAFASHGTLEFFTRPSQLSTLGWLWRPFVFAYFGSPVLGGLVFSGLIWAALNRRWRLVIWFFVTLVSTSEGWHFLVLIGALLAGVFLFDVASILAQQLSRVSAARASSVVLIPVVLLAVELSSLPYLTGAPTKLSGNTIRLGDWFQDQTTTEAHYLFLTPSQEAAEWLPYFLRRTPSVGFWGSEWLGTYDLQHKLTLAEVPRCLASQSFQCVEELIQRYDLRVDYLILPAEIREGPLLEALQTSDRWRSAYANPGYRVWRYRGALTVTG